MFVTNDGAANQQTIAPACLTVSIDTLPVVGFRNAQYRTEFFINQAGCYEEVPWAGSERGTKCNQAYGDRVSQGASWFV